jgi:hypothetical protein
MSDKSTMDKDQKTTTCSISGGHRYNANGRCEWCDAERGEVSEPTKTLTLPFIWRVLPSGDATLMLADRIEIGEVMFMPKANVWCALGCTIIHHRSTGHRDRLTAMAALEAAVMELDHG